VFAPELADRPDGPTREPRVTVRCARAGRDQLHGCAWDEVRLSRSRLGRFIALTLGYRLAGSRVQLDRTTRQPGARYGQRVWRSMVIGPGGPYRRSSYAKVHRGFIEDIITGKSFTDDDGGPESHAELYTAPSRSGLVTTT